IARVQAGGDDLYEVQQAAVQLTSGKDRPVSEALDRLADDLDKRSGRESAALEADVQRTLPVVLGVMIAAVVAGFGIALLFARSIASGVGRTAAVARRIARGGLPALLRVTKALAAGDLTQDAAVTTQPVAVSGRDEIGQMASDFNRMIEGLQETGSAFREMTRNLRELVGQVQQSAEGLAGTSQQLGAAAGQTSGAVQQVTDAVSAMAQGAGQVQAGAAQADRAGRALGEILQAVEQTVSQVSAIAAAAQEMAARSREVTTAMASISAVVKEATAATDQMAATAEGVGRSVSGIAAVAEENSAATEEVSASAEEMSAQVEEMSAQAEELAATAEQLRALVARFELEGDALTAGREAPAAAGEVRRGRRAA